MNSLVKLALEKGRSKAKEDMDRELQELLAKRKLEVGWREQTVAPSKLSTPKK